MKRFTFSAAVGLVAVAFAIAGCGGGATGITTAPAAAVASSSAPAAAPVASAAGSAATSGQSAGAASQTDASSAGTGGDGLDHPVNVCDLLPVATVASITDEPVTTATETDTPALESYGCYYAAAGTSGVTVTVAANASGTFDYLMQAALALGGEQVSGLGDKAYHAVLGVNALFGDVSIFASTNLAATALEPDAAAITLIKTIQPKL